MVWWRPSRGGREGDSDGGGDGVGEGERFDDVGVTGEGSCVGPRINHRESCFSCRSYTVFVNSAL